MTEVTEYNSELKGGQPSNNWPAYGSTVKRHPERPSVALKQTLTEITGPGFANGWSGPDVADLTKQHKGDPIGERMILAGRILDEDGKPVPKTLVEIWQANSAGRYQHANDTHPAPLDPNFTGRGNVVSNEKGEYRFLSLIPGAYPWRNTYNAWRSKHVHFSVFGPAFATRIITQMYFPGDPLLDFDPIYNAVPEEAARQRLIAHYDPNLSEAEWALGYRFDIVLRGRNATPVGV
ncbi:MAG TPA: protocatechuate 3,4-dioxygenase subunit beta [Stellaceae bacterium]|jgi:protocatechuate 3,4-dioxygenase beta subunit|nr:protocatechuate 3,4-dioxygenase subunit beta [Stellaceae bacterium]